MPIPRKAKAACVLQKVTVEFQFDIILLAFTCIVYDLLYQKLVFVCVDIKI